MVYATIKNLSQFKKAVKVGAMFEITNHCRPEQIGKIRTITRKQTNGFYSSNEVEYREGKIIPVERDLWCEFGKATDIDEDTTNNSIFNLIWTSSKSHTNINARYKVHKELNVFDFITRLILSNANGELIATRNNKYALNYYKNQQKKGA